MDPIKAKTGDNLFLNTNRCNQITVKIRRRQDELASDLSENLKITFSWTDIFQIFSF